MCLAFLEKGKPSKKLGLFARVADPNCRKCAINLQKNNKNDLEKRKKLYSSVQVLK